MDTAPEGWTVEQAADGAWSLTRGGAFSSETLEVAAGRLSVRRKTLGFGGTTTFTNASLEIDSSAGGGAVTEHRLWVLEKQRRTLLTSAPFPDTLRQLALFLSEQTGWSLKTVR